MGAELVGVVTAGDVARAIAEGRFVTRTSDTSRHSATAPMDSVFVEWDDIRLIADTGVSPGEIGEGYSTDDGGSNARMRTVR